MIMMRRISQHEFEQQAILRRCGRLAGGIPVDTPPSEAAIWLLEQGYRHQACHLIFGINYDNRQLLAKEVTTQLLNRFISDEMPDELRRLLAADHEWTNEQGAAMFGLEIYKGEFIIFGHKILNALHAHLKGQASQSASQTKTATSNQLPA